MTKQQYTFEILGGYLMNNNSVNAEYLAHVIWVTGINTVATYEHIKNTRAKTLSVVKNFICTFINSEMQYDYRYNNYKCTWQQVEKFNKLHNNSIDKVIEILTQDINNYRQELKEELENN